MVDSVEVVQVATEIMAMYHKHGGEEYAGEKVSQLEHMVQAAQLAQQQGFDDEVILAAFLHDIGHICEAAQGDNEMGGYGIKSHEEIAARYLAEKGFSKKIIRLVQSHVDAKRYLTCRYPDYFEQLSAASKKTLEYQGGKMTEEEAAVFEKDPLFSLIIQMRRWDEQAKIEGQSLPRLDYYHQLLIKHLEREN
ncbi:MAG: phosphonate degradation HD-domain oxygenase [Chitinophagaceae bacterium]